MPDRLYFTDSDEANELNATDPMALLIGFALDQQVTVQKAFSGPLALRERLGALSVGVTGLKGEQGRVIRCRIGGRTRRVSPRRSEPSGRCWAGTPA